MKTDRIRKWQIIMIASMGLAAWSCGDGPKEAEEEVSVRKTIVVPSEPEPASPKAPSKPAAAEPPSAVAEAPSPSDGSETGSQVASVTKKIPDIPSRPAEKKPSKKKEVEETAEVEGTPEEAPDGDTARGSEASDLPISGVPDIEETMTETEPETESDTEIVTIAPVEPDIREQPEQLDETGRYMDEETVLADQETTGPAAQQSDREGTAMTAERESPVSDGGVSESALASILGIAKKDKKKTTGYDPAGRIDPFDPLFKEKEEEPPPEEESAVEEDDIASTPKKKKRIPRTPLEKMDLNQLKLVGVIRAPSGNRALVEEASGKGYIISKGTYIGIHSGKVSEILKDKVIVEEEYEDIRGEVTVRKRELKIQRPPGEGFHEM